MRRAPKRRRAPRGSPLEDFFRASGRGLFGDVGERVSTSVRGAARRVALAGAGLTALLVGAVFILVGGAHALRAAGVPPSAAYLLVGLLGAVAGFALTKLR
jgi:hypothetical protein